jgi:hypothetical protein
MRSDMYSSFPAIIPTYELTRNLVLSMRQSRVVPLPLTDIMYLNLEIFIGFFHVQSLRNLIVVYVHAAVTQAAFPSCLYQNDFVFAGNSAFTITELQLSKTGEHTSCVRSFQRKAPLVARQPSTQNSIFISCENVLGFVLREDDEWQVMVSAMRYFSHLYEVLVFCRYHCLFLQTSVGVILRSGYNCAI